MNILYTETLYNWGGEQTKVLNEMKVFRELGHAVMLFCNPKSEILRRAQDCGFICFEQKMSKKNYHKSVPALCKIIKENGVNLVITNASTDSWIGAIAGIFYRKKGVKFVREKHNQFPIKSKISRFMHKNLFDKIIGVSASVCENLRQIGIKEEKIICIEPTINLDELNSQISSFKSEFYIPQDAISIGMFSALYHKKGVYEFAKSLKTSMTKNERIWGIFGGKINDDVKSEILLGFDENLQKRLVFTGFRDDIANVIKGIDVFIFPSHTEGLGIALLEAMALSRPIVAFDIAPMNELLAQNRGICVDFLNTDAMSEVINLYIKDENLRRDHGENASKFAKENYDIVALKSKLKIFLEHL